MRPRLADLCARAAEVPPPFTKSGPPEATQEPLAPGTQHPHPAPSTQHPAPEVALPCPRHPGMLPQLQETSMKRSLVLAALALAAAGDRRSPGSDEPLLGPRALQHAEGDRQAAGRAEDADRRARSTDRRGVPPRADRRAPAALRQGNDAARRTGVDRRPRLRQLARHQERSRRRRFHPARTPSGSNRSTRRRFSSIAR